MGTMYKTIDALCKKRDTNVTKMCCELGIPRSTLSELSAGRTKSLSLENATKIADYFGVSVDYLLTGEEKPADMEVGGEVGFDDFTYAMYNESKALSEHDKNILLALARELAAMPKPSDKEA